MSLSFIHHKHLSSSSSYIFYFHSYTSHHTHSFSNPLFLLHSKTSTSSLSLCASPSNAPLSSTTPISLPYLQQQPPHDPNYSLCETGKWVSSQHPQDQEKLYLENNPHTSCHLASDFDEEAQVSLENEEMGCCQKRELAEAEGIVGEIVELARNLPQNLTLEDALAEYEGRVSEKECWEVLETLGEDQFLLCCVCFFRWMRLQEPSLVSPRACTVLFPLLGKGGMSDEMMDFFRNLPSCKEFRDVHVYNATISGLMYGGSKASLAPSVQSYFLNSVATERWQGKFVIARHPSNPCHMCLENSPPLDYVHHELQDRILTELIFNSN